MWTKWSTILIFVRRDWGKSWILGRWSPCGPKFETRTFRMQAKSDTSCGNKLGWSLYQQRHEVTLSPLLLKITCIEKQRCVFAQSRNFNARFWFFLSRPLLFPCFFFSLSIYSPSFCFHYFFFNWNVLSFLLASKLTPPVPCGLRADCITHLFRCSWGSAFNLHYLKFITTFESIYAQSRKRSVNKWCRHTDRTQGRRRALWILEWRPSCVRTRVDENDCFSVTCVTPRRLYLIMQMAISWVALVFCSFPDDQNHCKNGPCLVNIKTGSNLY